jgi:hypothetical protein
MTGEGREGNDGVLADYPIRRRGLRVKLDKGFEHGIYESFVE